MSISPISGARSRAIETRDILASFDPDKFPDEILEGRVLEDILHDYPGRLLREESRTIQADLLGTIFQHATYDEDFFWQLSKTQSQSFRQLLFYQKVDRRVGRVFEQYDDLVDQARSRALSAEEEQEIQGIPSALQFLMDAIKQDLQNRRFQNTSSKAAKSVLMILKGICYRDEDLPRSARSRRAGLKSLFNMLIVAETAPVIASAAPPAFGIDILERISADTLQELQSDLNEVHGLLRAHAAPHIYLEKFEQLQ